MSLVVLPLLGLLLLYLIRKPLWKIIWRLVWVILWWPLVFVPLIVLGLLWFGYTTLHPDGGDNAPDKEVSAPSIPEPPGSNPSKGRATGRTPAANPARSLRSPITNPEVLPALPGTVANGNSRFAKNLENMMDEPEKKWYATEFLYVLEQSPNQQPFRWEYKAAGKHMFGQIEMGERFEAPSGSVCRPFGEILVVGANAQQLSGNACRNPGGAWCKVRPEGALTCDIGTLNGWDSTIMGFRRGVHRLKFW